MSTQITRSITRSILRVNLKRPTSAIKLGLVGVRCVHILTSGIHEMKRGLVLKLLLQRKPTVADHGLKLILIFGALATYVVKSEEQMVVIVGQDGGKLDFDFVMILRGLIVIHHVDEDFLAVFESARRFGKEHWQSAVFFFALHEVYFDGYVSRRRRVQQ